MALKRRRKLVACPDCGKKVRSLGHHRRYAHADTRADSADTRADSADTRADTTGPSIVEGSAPMQPEPLPPPTLSGDDQAPPDDTAPEPTASESDALRAAFGPQPEGPAGPDAPAGPEGLAPPPSLTPAALVQLAEAALYIVVRAACAAKRVPFDAQAQAAARLSKAERADLVALAPMATPYLARQLQAAPEWTGAAIFGATFAFTATAHVRAATVPRELPKPAQPAKPPAEPGWIAPGIPATPIA